MGAGLSSSVCSLNDSVGFEQCLNDVIAGEAGESTQAQVSRKATVNDLAAPGQLESPPVKPEKSSSSTGHPTVQPGARAHKRSLQTGIQDAPNPDQPPAKPGLGMLQSACGVHIEGSHLITTQSYNIYSNLAQPEAGNQDTSLLETIAEWLSHRSVGTGEWAFEDPAISNWSQGALRILWGVGMQGAGKTVLSSIIINHLIQKAKANRRICVAFAFARYTDQFTGENILAMYDHHRLPKTRPSQSEILEVLQAIFKSDLFDERYCTLDGLDEALADAQVEMLDAVSNLPVNFLLMSRPLPLLKELVPEATFINVMVYDTDIEQLIEEKLRRMTTLRSLLENEGWKDTVLKTLLEKSSGISISPLNMLSGCMKIKDLRSVLDTLPVGVNAMYEATMERIEGRPGLVRLVQYTAHDFLVAYPSKTGLDVQAMLAYTCVTRLRSCGFENYNGGMNGNHGVDVFKNHAFLRYSHQNWYTHARSSQSLPPFLQGFVQCCQRFPWKIGRYSSYDYLNSIQLAAACNFHHLLSMWLGFDPMSPNDPSPSPLDVNTESPDGRTALALAATHRHVEASQALLAASLGGHVQVVDLLLGFIDADHVNSGHWTALTSAALEGHAEVVKSLLRFEGMDVNARISAISTLQGRQEDIDVDASRPDGHTALSIALEEGMKGVVELLRSRGAK
ncbi:hypothetical protein FA15DRAFT_711698 [Coprinopsis marcescibilis]|uniref:Nephrocystin 3-like N-terminal domain-containing protein n=1 Tax=Coprinopsis marcescibilis TaxID=230819 RepID=A0A5C3K9D3_COPMA|nr:hypothetical protein FA15DRAFT_711698 [Coprinopsis marcescibilis]